MQNTHRRLHYVGFEAHPLTPVDWQRLAEQRPQPLFQDLAVAAPPLLSGWHRRSFAEGRIQLSVFHGDVLAGLQDLQARQRQPIDAWFLDGFDPRKNTQMWQPDVFNALAQCSSKGSRISTFTAAGQVRRGLAAVGFDMRRVDQRPRKRESLAGVYTLETQRSKTPQPAEMRVFGAGIAGCTIARSWLTKASMWRYSIPKALAQVAQRCRPAHCTVDCLGTPVALENSVLVPTTTPGKLWLITQVYEQSTRCNWPCQLTKCANNSGFMTSTLIPQVRGCNYLTPAELDQRLGINALSGLLFTNSALINLNLLCHQLADHPRVTLIPTLGQGRPDVIACASASRDLVTSMPLEIGDVYGQLDWIAPPDIPSADRLDTAIVGNGYVLPGAERWVLGSTYEQTPWPRATATEHNIKEQSAFLGKLRCNRCITSALLDVFLAIAIR